MIDLAALRRSGAVSRTAAMFIKEFVQLKRDRLTFATMIFIPVVQLLLFGYAINTTPRNLPTAVLLQEDSDLGRSILKALQNSAYFSWMESRWHSPFARTPGTIKTSGANGCIPSIRLRSCCTRAASCC